MKSKRTLIVVLDLIVLFAYIGATCILLNVYYNAKTKKSIDAYKQYYNATETLLDSIGVDVDSPYLETDAGSSYLDAKRVIDSI